MDKFKIIRDALNGVKVIELMPMTDDRGFFERLLCVNEFKELGLERDIVNINHSKTSLAGTIRGMHYQNQPSAEIKIVKCIRGAIHDVVVDIRQNSPTFLKYFSIDLTSDNNLLLYIPEGFAHGFQALEDDSEIIYFVTSHYSKELEATLNPFDCSINIKWPVDCTKISNKDKESLILTSSFEGIEERSSNA